jgi:hypothetical protein
MACLDEFLDQFGSDKSCRSRYKYMHGFLSGLWRNPIDAGLTFAPPLDKTGTVSE